jgi:oxygen-independent coproporphyrinogen III oxidase
MMDSVNAVHDQIEKALGRRHVNRVLHGHPSTMLWLERDVPVAEILEQGMRPPGGIQKGLILYVATPYCLPTQPARCGFCLFPSEVYRGADQLVTYLSYLEREGELYRPWLAEREVAAVYFGGGTTNLYPPAQYGDLLRMVRRVCPRLRPDAEITVEGVAQLFTRAKLHAMRDAGVTRVSMGVQQFDRELLKLSGRKQSVGHVLAMLECSQVLGLGSNVDLIYGWPDQTVAHMLRDLEVIVEHRIPHLTHYELNVAGRSDFARRRRDLPSVEQNLEMYRTAKPFLGEHGYRQVTPYDWERVDAGPAATLTYEWMARAPFHREPDGRITGYDVWGWGFAGVSKCVGLPDTPGWTFMNCARVDDYFRRLDEGRFPAERGYHFEPPDQRLYVLFQMLETTRVDRLLYEQLYNVDPLEEYAPLWQAFREREWVLVDTEYITLIGDGVFHTPLVQGLLATDRLEAMRRTRAVRHEATGVVLDEVAS